VVSLNIEGDNQRGARIIRGKIKSKERIPAKKIQGKIKRKSGISLIAPKISWPYHFFVNGARSQRLKTVDRTLMPPCQEACPLNQDIREYVDLIAQGRIMEALKVIRDKNPFPSICA